MKMLKDVLRVKEAVEWKYRVKLEVIGGVRRRGFSSNDVDILVATPVSRARAFKIAEEFSKAFRIRIDLFVPLSKHDRILWERGGFYDPTIPEEFGFPDTSDMPIPDLWQYVLYPNGSFDIGWTNVDVLRGVDKIKELLENYYKERDKLLELWAAKPESERADIERGIKILQKKTKEEIARIAKPLIEQEYLSPSDDLLSILRIEVEV
jgi:predicted nucleotidyltransferase